MTEILRLANLSRRFGHATVLADINLQLHRGERLAAIGYSGSGKTTLLRLIAGLDVPSTGEIAIAGETVSSAGRLLVSPQRRGVAMVFQGLALFPHLRALDQIIFAARGPDKKQRAVHLLERIGLAHRASAPLDQLSGGERQRIALARALAQQPDLLLMDEPFASLDDQRRSEMRSLLRSLLDETNTTLILVTHSRDDALDLAQRVLVLDRGVPVACDKLEALLAHPRHAAAVRCLGLGDLIDAHTDDGTTAMTALGPVPLALRAPPGSLRLLVRPAQAQVTTGTDGCEAEVTAIKVRPPNSHEVRHVATVRAAGQQLSVHADQTPLTVGQRIRIKIHGACEAVGDTNTSRSMAEPIIEPAR